MSTELNRKSKCPELGRSSELSNSPKEKNPSDSLILSKWLRSLQEFELPETNEIEMTGEQDLFKSIDKLASDTCFKLRETNEIEMTGEQYLFKSIDKLASDTCFKLRETLLSSGDSSDSETLTASSEESSTSPKIATKYIPTSKLFKESVNLYLFDSFSKSNSFKSSSKLTEQSIGSKLPDLSVKSKLTWPSDRSILPDSSVKSKLSDTSTISELHRHFLKTKLSYESRKSKLSEQSARSKLSEQSLKSDFPFLFASSNFPSSSLKSKPFDSSVCPRFTDSSAKSKQHKLSSRLKLHDKKVIFAHEHLKLKFTEACGQSNEGAVSKIQNIETSLQQFNQKILEFFKSRRPHFVDLEKYANKAKLFMELGITLKRDCKKVPKISNTYRWKRIKDDWLLLIKYWDSVAKDVNMIIKTISMFDDSYDNKLLTGENIQYFMREILEVIENISKLIDLCQNGHLKYDAFCSSKPLSLFLMQVDNFELNIESLLKAIKNESEQFTQFKKSLYSDGEKD